MSRYWNNQRYCECALVTLWNAAIFHGIEVPSRYGPEYDSDCNVAHAIHGGTIRADHVLTKLGLLPVLGELTWDWVSANLPVEFKIFCHRGYHSVLAVAVTPAGGVLIANYARNRLHRMSFQKLVEKHNRHAAPISYRLTEGESDDDSR